MEIKGFQENSMLEWEGRLSCIIFLPYCNLQCRYCHAAHLLEPEDTPTIPREKILSYMRSQEGWLDGAAITGGEPTLHGEELRELIRDIRATGLEVLLETNGTNPDMLDDLLSEGLLTALSMDVKAPLDPECYAKITQTDVDVHSLRASINLLKNSGIEYEFRTTVAPGLVGPEELKDIAPELEGARAHALQNFQPDHCLDPAMRKVAPFSPDEMDELANIAEPYADRIIIRGRDHGVIHAAEQ
ncbi:MAG: anaerobic ribonucleoside-triphosphate reductase activating protein [Planctomycetota bacterium]